MTHATRVVVALLAGLLVLSACDGAATSSTPAASSVRDVEPDDSNRQVLTTFTVLADMARNVAGDALEVESITRPGAEIHEYEPTPSDLQRAGDAGLILENGLGLEQWFERFIDRTDAQRVTVTEGIDTIPIQAGAYEGDANPHAWMSPTLAVTYVENMRDAFIAYAPEHSEEFEANAAAYIEEIEAVEDYLRTELARLPEHQRALVTCEGAFSYLARDLELGEHYLWPVNSDSEGTPQQIADTVTFVSDHDIPAVFCESTVNDSAQQQVARQTGARMGETLYVDSLSEPDGPVPTYLDLLRHDAEAIVHSLLQDES